MSDLSKAKIQTLKIKIKVEIEGKIFEKEINNDEYFCCALMHGVRNKKNPVDVITYLADEGAKHLISNPIPHFKNGAKPEFTEKWNI